MSKRSVHAPANNRGRSLRQVLQHADLPALVPQLEPRTLHRLVQAVGLEDAGDIVRLATPTQLLHVLDTDVWSRADRGAGEQFDAERFGLWLRVLVEEDLDVATAKLEAFSRPFLVAAFSQHIAVASRHTATLRGLLDTEQTTEIGGILVIARRLDAWDAIVALLAHLHDERPALFGELIAECRQLSYEYLEEESGFDSLLSRREQALADMAFDREHRLELQGYVTRPRAVAFLEAARRLDTSAVTPGADPLAAGYFRDLREPGSSPTDQMMPKAQPVEEERAVLEIGHAELLAAIAEVESDAARKPVRALLGAGERSEISAMPLVDAHVRFWADADPVVHGRCIEELGFLANVLFEGGVLHDRRFTEREASDAAVATCNLGLECWPAHWVVVSTRLARSEAGHGTHHVSLVDAFRVGWATLHTDVCTEAATQLAGVLGRVPHGSTDTHEDVAALRRALQRAIDSGRPWEARPRMDVLAILDTPCWATLLHLINPCPVVPKGCLAAVGARKPSRYANEFEFIASRRAVSWAHQFCESLLAQLSDR